MRPTYVRAGLVCAVLLGGVACAGILDIGTIGYGAADAAAGDATVGDAGADGRPVGEGGAIHCGAGTKLCDDTCVVVGPSYGCSVDGGCGACPGEANAATSCIDGGGCTLTCAPGFADCNGAPSDGCEVQPDAGDPKNCGRCGNRCSGGTPYCSSGGCVAVCGAPLVECDGGCVDTQGSPANCGGCGKVCPSGPFSTVECASGVCGIFCSGDHLDCNRDAGDGCEVDRLRDPLNCGQCSFDCSAVLGVATGGCANGTCVVTTCQPNRLDCNNNPADGCECDVSLPGNICLSTGQCGACKQLGQQPCLEAADCCGQAVGAICPGNKCCLSGNSPCTADPQCCVGACVYDASRSAFFCK